MISHVIWRQHFSKFKGFVCANYLSAPCSKAKGLLHLLDKPFTADSYALGPFDYSITIAGLH
jgi:hypothetical protein